MMTDSPDILGSLMQQLGGGGISEIARSVGLSSGDVGNVLAGAVPAMMAGLTRNAASSGGAEGLLGALDSDGDGDSMDDIVKLGSGLLGGLFKG